MSRPAAMIFAAGLGTRMRPLTVSLPKPLIRVAGRALIDHALGLARAAGCGPIVVNTHYLSDQIQGHLAGQDVILSHEPQLLETGGGLRAALPHLGAGPVMVLNADVVWTGPNPLTQLAAAWDAGRMEALLLTLPGQQALGHAGRGDFVADASGRLTRAAGRAGEVYLGAQILRTERLREVAEAAFSLNLIWDAMIGAGGLLGLRHRGGWCDVGRPASIALAEALLRDTP